MSLSWFWIVCTLLCTTSLLMLKHLQLSWLSVCQFSFLSFHYCNLLCSLPRPDGVFPIIHGLERYDNSFSMACSNFLSEHLLLLAPVCLFSLPSFILVMFFGIIHKICNNWQWPWITPCSWILLVKHIAYDSFSLGSCIEYICTAAIAFVSFLPFMPLKHLQWL